MSNKTKIIELLNTDINKEAFNDNGMYAICYNGIRIYTIYINNDYLELYIDNKRIVNSLQSYYNKKYELQYIKDYKLCIYLFLCSFKSDFIKYLKDVSLYLLTV